MNTTFDRLKLFFLGVLAISCAAIWSYQVFYVWPRERCERAGGWWDGKDRRCGVPVAIWRFTGRKPGHPTTTAAAPSRR
jgi:hypothetical protein